MKVLMCPPSHYEVVYEINVWMDKDNQVDIDRAHQQYKNLVDVYRSLGVEVMEIDQSQDLPDMVYSANYGFLDGDIFVLSNFFNEQRRREAGLAMDYLGGKGYKIKQLPNGMVFEGQGDMVKCGDKLFCGYGYRTQLDSIKELGALLGKEIVPIKLVDPRWYHLDTCFFGFADGKAFIASEAFDKDSLKAIYDNCDSIIETNEPEDIAGFACNSVAVGNKVICYRMSDKSKKAFSAEGFEVVEVDVSEFLKGGGSVRCLTLDL